MILNPVSIYPYDKPAYKAPGTVEGAQLGNHANSAAPSAATLSNTAAGYTTLGGKFGFAAVAGAETDYALFGYQVPATHRLWIRGVAISAFNFGAAVATTAHTLEWALGLNSTAVSLATTDSDPTFGPRRLQVGAHSLATSAIVGAAFADISRKFEAPLRIEPSRYLHTILRMPVASATSNQVIRGQVAFDGFFEKIGQ